MDVHLAEELLNELGSSLEMLETQQGALLQFLKDKGVITDEQFAPYLTQAGNASNVRWRAARLRLEHILSAIRDKEQLIRKQAEHESKETQSSPQKQTASSKTKRVKEAAQPMAEEQTQNREGSGRTETKPPTKEIGEQPTSEQSQPSPRQTASDKDAA
jgi:hypothetical protein